MSEAMNRRDALRLAGAAGTGAVVGGLVTRAARPSPPRDDAPQPRAGWFFTPRERRMVEVLVDDILPADERSGSATDAKVPDFLEAILLDEEVEAPMTKVEMRGGLAWLDTQCRSRFQREYADCSVTERHLVLDDIALPDKARAEMRAGAVFFGRLRDFVASGFFTSEMGHRDLGYRGGIAVAEWKGCPDAALGRLGVSYGEWDARYGARAR